MTFHDEFVVTIGDDGLVILWNLEEIGASKKEQEITYAEEILITKSDLEEKVTRKKRTNSVEMVRFIFRITRLKI